MPRPLLATVLSLALAAPLGARAQDAKADQGEKPAPAEEKPALDLDKLPFTSDTIKLVMEAAQPKIQECYEEMLAGLAKPVDGKILTSFAITPEGLVKKARVEKKGTTLKNSKFHACVVAVLSGLQFPKPPDSRDHPIEFPFNLKAVK